VTKKQDEARASLALLDNFTAQLDAQIAKDCAAMAEWERKSVERKLNWCAPKPVKPKGKPGGVRGSVRGPYKTVKVYLNGANVKHYFDYDEVHGVLRRMAPIKGGTRGASTVVGHVTKTTNPDNEDYNRYVVVFDKETYNVSTIAHLWMTGDWPTREPVHANGDKHDNRWRNLIWR
jgi:hypothetical protein